MDGIDQNIVIKLGGSVITYKDRALALRSDAIDALSEVLSKHRSRKIIVHGGGSFGHYYAKKAGLSTDCRLANTKDAFLTRNSMFTLNRHIVHSLHTHGIQPYVVTPFVYHKRSNAIRSLILKLLIQCFTPLFFGDVIPCENGLKIISGDDISYRICSIIKPSRMIFCIDVDGIYASPSMKGSIIEEFNREMLKVFIGHNMNVDVTGGIVRKLQIATEISNLGVDVYLVNGLKPEIVLKALNGVSGIGTCIKGMK